jgi:hypothetical protein
MRQFGIILKDRFGILIDPPTFYLLSYVWIAPSKRFITSYHISFHLILFIYFQIVCWFICSVNIVLVYMSRANARVRYLVLFSITLAVWWIFTLKAKLRQLSMSTHKPRWGILRYTYYVDVYRYTAEVVNKWQPFNADFVSLFNFLF